MGLLNNSTILSSRGIPYWFPTASNIQNQTQNEKLSRRSVREGERYRGIHNSFSGADIIAYIHIPQQPVRGDLTTGPGSESEAVVGVLGNMQTISYSTFREVNPVRSLGNIYPNSYTRGPRTVAGTLVWTILDQYVLSEALKSSYINEYDPSTILIDQIPPFNIIITFNNEYGDVATMGIYGVRIVNEGATFSIDDMISEQTNTYVASDIDMLHKGPPFRNQKTRHGLMTSSDILMKEARRRMSSHGSALQ